MTMTTVAEVTKMAALSDSRLELMKRNFGWTSLHTLVVVKSNAADFPAKDGRGLW